MKLGIILSSSQAETNWNAFRLANLALSKGDIVSIFLVGEGVEYGKNSSAQFDIHKQVQQFIHANGKIIACGTCIALRKQHSTEECPAGSLEDLYRIVADNDKVLTF